MIISKEIAKLMSTINNGMIWIYIGIFFAGMYLLISLLTWSFVKPLKYLGIPTVLVGVLFLTIRILSGLVIGFLGGEVSIIKAVLPGVLKPILFNGIVCLLLGILMIVLYIIINKTKKSKKENIIQPKNDINSQDISE